MIESEPLAVGGNGPNASWAGWAWLGPHCTAVGRLLDVHIIEREIGEIEIVWTNATGFQDWKNIFVASAGIWIGGDWINGRQKARAEIDGFPNPRVTRRGGEDAIVRIYFDAGFSAGRSNSDVCGEGCGCWRRWRRVGAGTAR